MLFVQTLRSPLHERALLAVAPAVLMAQDYSRTCISGAKTTSLPVIRPCERRFGPPCLLHFYPRRCGGLSPVTMVRDYWRQSTRLPLLSHYDAVATLSEHMRREFLRHGLPGHQVHVLPAVDPMTGVGEETVPQLRILDQTPDEASVSRLAYLGRIDVLKGCHMLLRALGTVARKLPGRIVLTVAGDGPDLSRCREAARELTAQTEKVEVHFVGWVSPERCRMLLGESDLLVVPSLWPEPFGLVGVEALQRGVPVVAFAVGGIPEWLEDGSTGILAPGNPPTAIGLSEAIVRCMTSTHIRRTVRARAICHKADLSVERHLGALMPLLLAAAGSAQRRGA